MINVDIEKILKEVERRWLERTPAKSIDEVDPAYRVSRGEIRLWCSQNNIILDELDADLELALAKLYKRLKKEYPHERWDKGTLRMRAVLKGKIDAFSI